MARYLAVALFLASVPLMSWGHDLYEELLDELPRPVPLRSIFFGMMVTRGSKDLPPQANEKLQRLQRIVAVGYVLLVLSGLVFVFSGE